MPAKHSAPQGGIYQYFLGRDERADLFKHEGMVLERIVDFEWEKLKAYGIETIYLLGLFDNRGPIIVTEEEGESLPVDKDRLPSPFALRDHTSINPLLGTITQFAGLIERLKKLDFKIVVDFVPNHTGTTHPWVSEHPEYYVKEEGKLTAEFSGDVYKLDYQNNQLSQEMVSVLEQIVSLRVDGVRVDMAHLIPNSFWKETIEHIHGLKPEFIFIAEAYHDTVFDWEPLLRLIESGFDQIYHEYLFRNVKNYLTAAGSLQDVAEHINYTSQQLFSPNLVNYVMNHDDYLVNSQAITPLTALTMLLPGNFFIYNGQLAGWPKRIAHHRHQVLPKLNSELQKQNEQFCQLYQFIDQNKPAVDKCLVIDEVVLSLTFTTTGGKTGAMLINLGGQDYRLDDYEDYERSWKLEPNALDLVSNDAIIYLD
jgi:hypothetical protein